MTPATWYAVHGPNGDLTWRVTGPADLIGAKLRLIPEDEGMDIAYPNEGPHFPWQLKATEEEGATTTLSSKDEWKTYTTERRRLQSLETVYPEHEGSAVFTRPMSWLATHGLELRRQGVRVLAEVDDNYMSPSRLNVMFDIAEATDRDRDDHARSICSMDGIIVSTDYLRDQYRTQLKAYFPGEKIPEIHVCRNHVDERHIPEVPEYDGPLRVGYMGSDSHIWDVDLIYPALAKAKEKGCRIVMVGINPASVNPKYRRKNWDWEALDYEHIPWMLDYRGTALPLDVGLAPLLANTHTLCKSDIKALEYALSGAACVAQNNEVYTRTLTHGEHVLLAGSPREFVIQTEALLDDRGLRERLASNTLEYVREERMLADHKDEWLEAIVG